MLCVVVLLCACDARGREESDQMKPPPGHGPYTGTVADWPLWFVRHGFSARCFSVQDCTIDYAGHRQEVMGKRPRPSIESLGFPLEKILHGSRGPIANFPPPAEVEWIAMDGTQLRARVDMARIFQDRMVRHSTAREDIRENTWIHYPDIILVVNDRSIDVYMRTAIPLKRPSDPDNPRTDMRYEVVLVESGSY